MDQSRSTEASVSAASIERREAIVLPKRSFSIEFFVGLFTILTLSAAGYLAVGLGGYHVFGGDVYYVQAEFDNISGLEQGASVEIAGVKIGEVVKIDLEDPLALITMRLDSSVAIREDDTAAVRTKGIIGDRYVKISRGSGENLAQGKRMVETESVIDIEDIIGKIVHSLTKEDEETETAPEPEGEQDQAQEQVEGNKL